MHFGTDVDKTLKWMTEDKVLEAKWSRFAELLGYTIQNTEENEDANGWRAHDNDGGSLARSMISFLYMTS